jgi:hypothetical protein
VSAPAIEAVGVVIPAHDEAALLPRCLAALDLALAQLPAALRRLAVIVLDACDDASPRIIADWSTGAVHRACQQVAFRNVGRARAAGMQHVLGTSETSIRRRSGSRRATPTPPCRSTGSPPSSV